VKAELYWISGVSGRLAIMPRPRGGEWLADEIRSLKRQGVDVLVSMLTSEENGELELGDEAAAAKAAGLGFISFPMEDRSVPADDDTVLSLADRLLVFVRSGQGVAVHCRGGVGRSAMLVACVLDEDGQVGRRGPEPDRRRSGLPRP
jgi:protein tyrosine phosphatase (PTP) superfamily phosphohydrolase (DUF442 family)